MANAALKIHNDARAEIGVGSLHWDDNLAAHAQSWANELALQNKFDHSGIDGEGENLWMGSQGSDGSFASAAHSWVDEKRNYHGKKIGEGDLGSFGHYTQCVWPSTKAIGMAVSTASDGSMYIVGRYSPPGNWSGESPKKITDGLFLINAFKNGQFKSGVAWYKDLLGSGGHQPDAFIDLMSNSDSGWRWEGHCVQGTFPDGNTVTIEIEADAQKKGDYSKVGTVKNKYRSFEVFKDRYRMLFEKEGWEVFTVYWCQ